MLTHRLDPAVSGLALAPRLHSVVKRPCAIPSSPATALPSSLVWFSILCPRTTLSSHPSSINQNLYFREAFALDISYDCSFLPTDVHMADASISLDFVWNAAPRNAYLIHSVWDSSQWLPVNLPSSQFLQSSSRLHVCLLIYLLFVTPH